MDISTPEYRYYMAKCCENMGDNENAIVCYSVLKRIAPLSINYIEEYAAFLFKIKRKKAAYDMIKSVLGIVSSTEKERLKKVLKNYK